MMVEPVNGTSLSGHAVPYISVQENKLSGNLLLVLLLSGLFLFLIIMCLSIVD